MEPHAAGILLIEDNPADARYTQLALEDLGISNELRILRDGEAALDYLFRRGEYSDAPRPDCILLDWNLPKADGSEVLEIIRGEKNLSDIPVFVLTSSREQIDVLEAYNLRADGYITKPIDLSGLHTIMEVCNFRILLLTNPAGQKNAGGEALAPVHNTR